MSERQVVERFWPLLYAHDWDGIAACFGPESIYYDVPTGKATSARGPADIVARLRLGLEPLAGHDHVEGLIVSAGEHVVTEHAETWTWVTGESVTLPFVSMMVVRAGVIHRWRDYWDYATLMNAAPAAWLDRLATSDLAWLHDATDDW